MTDVIVCFVTDR